MRVYIAYKFTGADKTELKERLEKLSKLIEETLGWETFIFFRDAQNWGEIKMDIKEVTQKAMQEIEKCDAILVEASEKANGVYFEVGYAKALNKKIIIIHKKDKEANFLDSTADVVIEYGDDEDLREKLVKAK